MINTNKIEYKELSWMELKYDQKRIKFNWMEADYIGIEIELN